MTRDEILQLLTDRCLAKSRDLTHVSTSVAAELLHASEATIKRWADAGKLACTRSAGGHRLIDITNGLPDLKVNRDV